MSTTKPASPAALAAYRQMLALVEEHGADILHVAQLKSEASDRAWNACYEEGLDDRTRDARATYAESMAADARRANAVRFFVETLQEEQA